MELTEALKERRSIRKFEDKPIPHEVIEEIVDAARFAPSWKNTQISRYVVVEDRALLEKIAKNCVCGFEHNTMTMMGAPALLVQTFVRKRSGFERDGSYSTSKEGGWEMFDCGIAAQAFCLKAHELGIGTCIMGIFDEEAVKEALGLDETMGIGCLIPIGYIPEGEYPAPKRKEVNEILSFR